MHFYLMLSWRKLQPHQKLLCRHRRYSFPVAFDMPCRIIGNRHHYHLILCCLRFKPQMRAGYLLHPADILIQLTGPLGPCKERIFILIIEAGFYYFQILLQYLHPYLHIITRLKNSRAKHVPLSLRKIPAKGFPVNEDLPALQMRS